MAQNQTSLSPEEVRELSKLTKEEWREYTKTVWQIANTTHPSHPAVFPEEIPLRLIKMFTFVGDTVLDPFAGTGTTGQVAVKLNRRAICVEQNPNFAAIIRERKLPLDVFFDDPLQVVEGDSRAMPSISDSSIGLVVTSPPYWNKADYGSNGANIGSISQYKKFLKSIRPVFQECYRVLTPGRKMCIVTANVNQHTDQGLLTFPLAADFVLMLREIGFVMVTEVIWSKDGTGGKWGSFGEQRPIFGSYPYPPNFLFKNIHEYVLVFAKPPSKKIKSPKALPYEWLMEED